MAVSAAAAPRDCAGGWKGAGGGGPGAGGRGAVCCGSADGTQRGSSCELPLAAAFDRAEALARHCFQACTARSWPFWDVAPSASLTSASQSKQSARVSMSVMPKAIRLVGAMTPSVLSSPLLRLSTKVGPGLPAPDAATRCSHCVAGCTAGGRAGCGAGAPAQPAPRVTPSL